MTEYKPKMLAMKRNFWTLASQYPYALDGVTVKPDVVIALLEDLQHCEACLAEAKNEIGRMAEARDATDEKYRT